jgi:hypothetical protein
MKTLVGTKPLGKISKKLTNDIPTLKINELLTRLGGALQFQGL